MNNLRKWLESNQCIDGNRCNHKNWHPWHDLPKLCRGENFVCPVWIWTTEYLLSHPRTSFSINERWYNRYNTHRSTINKRRLEAMKQKGDILIRDFWQQCSQHECCEHWYNIICNKETGEVSSRRIKGEKRWTWRIASNKADAFPSLCLHQWVTGCGGWGYPEKDSHLLNKQVAATIIKDIRICQE